MNLIELVGGIWCGAQVRAPHASHWIWVNGPSTGPRPQVYHSPGAGRIPYRCIEERKDLDFYLYAGGSHRDCPGCGAVHAMRDKTGQTVKSCTLCGRSFQARSAR